MRKKMFALTSVLALVLATSLAGGADPVAAHTDHTSCAGGVVAVIEAIDDQDVFPHGPGLGIDGGLVSSIATSGSDALPAAVDDAHQVVCEPK